MTKKTITYAELARRVGDCVLNNEIRRETEERFEWDVVNGETHYCYKHETEDECEKDRGNCDYEKVDIYQEYIITKSGADYLIRNTDEVVFYCEDLNMYLWGITHFGTSWDGVHTTIKSN